MHACTCHVLLQCHVILVLDGAVVATSPLLHMSYTYAYFYLRIFILILAVIFNGKALPVLHNFTDTNSDILYPKFTHVLHFYTYQCVIHDKTTSSPNPTNNLYSLYSLSLFLHFTSLLFVSFFFPL